jgi:HlyD family secretion protein
MTKRRILFLAGLALLVAVVIAGYATRGFGLMAKPPGPLKLYGNVDIRQVDLAFRVPGRITSMAFDEGASVPAGAVRAQLDARPLRDAVSVANAQVALADAELAKRRNGNRAQDIAQARAQLAEQLVTLAKARADLARRESLLPSGAISQAVVDANRADLGVAEARTEAAREALALQRAGARREDVRAAEAQRASAVASQQRARTDLDDTAIIAP